MRRTATGLAGLLTLLLTGCTGTEPQSSPTAEADSTGGKPQLAVTSLCYSECASTAPLGLPDVAVYADGRILSVDRTGTDSRPVLRSGQLQPAELARLQALAIASGLSTGGVSTIARTDEPTGGGGGTTFTVRLRSTLTTVEVPFLDTDEPAADRYADPARVMKMVELDKALRAAAALADTDLAPSSYVVQARLAATRVTDSRPWPGPALAGLPQVGNGLRCAIVTGAATAAVARAVDADGFGGRYTSGGRLWQVVGRALLPHEQNCADVKETADAATAAGPRYPGDRRP